MSKPAKKHSLLGRIFLGLLLFVLLAAAAAFVLYKMNTPLTEYVDYQLAYYYEGKGEYEKAVSYYEKIGTEQSLEYSDSATRKLAKEKLENKDYLGTYKAYSSLHEMTRSQREEFEKIFSDDAFLSGLREQLKDPSLTAEELPEYIPVKITTENFEEFFTFSQEIDLNVETGECTTFYLHLKEELRDAFDYDNEFNYLNFDYLYHERVRPVYNYDRLGGVLRDFDTPFDYRIRGLTPSMSLRAFSERKGKDSLAEIKANATFGYYDFHTHPDEAYVAEDIYLLEADGLLFFRTELFR